MSNPARVAAWNEVFSALGHNPHELDDTTKRVVWDAMTRLFRASGWTPPASSSEASPRREASGARSAVAGDGWMFRFGRNSGKRPDEVEVADLRWYERVFLESIDNPEKARFRDNNQRALDVVRAELRRRGEAGDW